MRFRRRTGGYRGRRRGFARRRNYRLSRGGIRL